MPGRRRTHRNANIGDARGTQPRGRTLVSALVLVLAFAACDSGGGATPYDAGFSFGDAASPSQAAQEAGVDAAAALPSRDASVSLDGSGGTAPMLDAATLDASPLDAGSSDAGAGMDDSGSALDGGDPSLADGSQALGDGAVDAAIGPDASGGDGSTPSDGGGGGDGGVDYSGRGPYEVVTEKNVGTAFRNNVSDDTFFCNLFIGALGGSNPDVDKELTTYPADMNRGLYTLFRPKQLEQGKTYPVLTWGNGTCSHPLLFDELIEHVVSHGFIVIASNSRQVGDGQVMLRGIDFILAENANPSSPLYGKVDTKMIGAFGHSQGSMATVKAAADRRIVASVPIMGAATGDVGQLKGPTFFIAGEKDTIVNPSGVHDAYNVATVPAVYGLSLGQDHLMPGLNPALIWDSVVAWFKIHLEKQQAARDYFYGDACRLCKDPRWKIERKGL